MRIRNQFSAFLLFSMLPTAVPACSCVVGSMGFCQALPYPSSADRAVFLGRVTEFYPKSRAELNPILEEFARTHRDLQEALSAQSPNTATRHVAGGSAGNLEWRKQMTEYIWSDKLTPAEQAQLLDAADERELDRLGFDQRRRARLEVLENFLGADAPDFMLYTALDGPACGFDFSEGGTYLIEAYRQAGSDTWQVTSCSRTRPVQTAAEDLKVLRAWKVGQRLPGRISGQIIDRRPTPGIGTAFQVRLLGGKQVLEVTSDSRGKFGFENLDAGVYQVQVVQPPVFSRPADLSRAWCAMVFVTLSP